MEVMKTILAGLVMAALVLGNVAADEGSSGPVVGIGVGIHAVDHHPVIDQVIPGNAAFKSGVKAGDRLLKVNGKSVDGVPLPDIAKLLRGAAGTKVRIVVQRPGESGPRSFSLERQMVTLLPAAPTGP
jgi:carboxyl-terminal processing protease